MSALWQRPYAAYLFDLDGTLIDTAPDLNVALNFSLHSIGLGPVDEALTRHWVGHGARAMLEQALLNLHKPVPADLSRQIDGLLSVFLDYYQAHPATYSQVYPGVQKALATLRTNGAKLAVVTNKMYQMTTPILAATGLAGYFDVVVGGDTAAQPKPSAAPLDYALRHLGCQADQALMVGDSQTDALAARAAGMHVVCVRDGYNHGMDVASLDVDGVIDDFSELTAAAGCS